MRVIRPHVEFDSNKGYWRTRRTMIITLSLSSDWKAEWHSSKRIIVVITSIPVTFLSR